jgi:elongation factor G
VRSPPKTAIEVSVEEDTMHTFAPDKIHNVGLFGHGGCGKTTLMEALLYTAHATNRLGRVEDGNTVSDYDPDEQKRHMSMNMALASLEWNHNKVTLIDTPGYSDFLGDVVAAMRVVDGAIIVLDASGGVEVGTEAVWEEAVKAKVPRMLFINKMDRENADFFACIQQAQERLDAAVIPMQIPIGAHKTFRGVISLRQEKAWLLGDKHDGSFVEAPIPDELKAEADQWHDLLIDKIAATNDDLIEKYLEGQALTADELRKGLRAGIMNGTIVPVFCGSALLLSGMAQLLNGILDCVPSAARRMVNPVDLHTRQQVTLKPEASAPLSALVFKTIADQYGRLSYFRVYSGEMHSNSAVHNARSGKDERIAQLFQANGKELIPVAQIAPGDIGVVTKLAETLTNDTICSHERPLALRTIAFPQPTFTAVVRPHSRSDLDKLGSALHQMLEEDPTLQTSRDAFGGETLLSGLGESHLQIVAERMRRKFGVSIDTDLPRIPYRETIRSSAEAQYRHKKQTGGAGQFADVSLRIEPIKADENADPLEFVNAIVGGVISRGFMPAIEKGVREAMEEGLLAGSPVAGVRVTVFDGKEHPVDSKEIAFKTAGKEAFKLAAAKAQPVVMEPVYMLEITVPEQYAGDVMSDINTRRGRVLGMMPCDSGKTTVTAQVPLAECQRYTTELRSLSQGRGKFVMQFDHYEDVPQHLAQQLLGQLKKEREHGGNGHH